MAVEAVADRGVSIALACRTFQISESCYRYERKLSDENAEIADVRKIIYTTNAIESLNRVIRKTTKTRGSFPTDDAATKLIYLAIRNFEKKGRCVREWVVARNQFAILYPERFNR